MSLPLVLLLVVSIVLLVALVVLKVGHDRKIKTMEAAAKRGAKRASKQVARASKQVARVNKVLKQRERSLKRTFRVFNDLIVKEVREGSDEQLNKMVSTFTADEIRNIRRTSAMGITRLLIEKGHHNAAVCLLTKYVQPNRGDQLLYFLEPLLELHKVGLLQGEFHDFCSLFGMATDISALHYLGATYEATDEVDQRNFQQLIIEPLSRLTKNGRHLMDIRFSAEQRRTLADHVRAALNDKKGLSLIRLGDGEAYAYPVVLIEGLPISIFEKDDTSFELNWWNARPTASVREDLVARIRIAVARCDILGFPSVYRVIRDLPPPRRRYGKNRNQRAFVRLLRAIGETIPLNGKLLTEERCHRIKGAIDAALILELARAADSVVLVSSLTELASKFPVMNIQTIPVPPEDALVKIFDVYSDVVDRVRNASKPGTLVLVGAGIIGKIFVDEAKMRGAVALDVGSLFDYMVERKTRTIADLI
jgi:hypothetical protein